MKKFLLSLAALGILFGFLSVSNAAYIRFFWGDIEGEITDQTDLQDALNLKSDKLNVLELDNTSPFVPDSEYEPTTKKYVDDNDADTTDHTLLLNIGLNTHDQTDSALTRLVNTSGTNTGDQDLSPYDTHISALTNPHAVSKSQVGLGNVDNTSDLDKPISTATQTALNLKADDSDLTSHTGDDTIHFNQAEISIPASQISDFDTEVSNNIDVASNTTHRTSDGSNHTFIDQSVISGATPTFTGANFTGIDHGTGLIGLSDDDHSQYALLAGRSGGQVLIGGSDAADGVSIQSTSNATKGKIYFGTNSVYDEAIDKLGILQTSPTASTHIKGATSDNTDYALKIDDSSDDSLLSLRNDGRFLHKGRSFVPENVIVVNGTADLPPPTDTGDGLGTAYRLEDGMTYDLGAAIVLSYPIVMSDNLIKGGWNSPIVYVGSGALFRNNSTTPLAVGWLYRVRAIGDGTNEFMDIQDSETLLLENINVISFKFGRSINNVEVYLTFTTPINITDQLDVCGTQNIFLIREQNNATMSDNNGKPLYNFRCAGGVVSINHITGAPYEDDALFNFDPVTWDGRADIEVSYFDNSNSGEVFLVGSLDQTDPRIRVTNFMDGVPDSQKIGSMYLERNTTVTTITDVGDDGIITAFSDAGVGETTVTSAAHGLSNGDDVLVLDTGYSGIHTINDVTTNTFDIVVAFTGTTTGIWESGWESVAGTTIAGQNEEFTMSGNNELTAQNIETKRMKVTASINPRNENVAAVKAWEFMATHNGIRIPGTMNGRDMTNRAGQGMLLGTVDIIAGDVIKVYARNVSDTGNSVMENMSVVIE